MQKITASTRINEILNEYPELTDYLMELRLCRGDIGPGSIMDWELSRAAAEEGLDLRSLLVDLNNRI